MSTQVQTPSGVYRSAPGSRTAPPVTVTAKSGCGQVQPCSGPTAQYAGERVTVIPVHRKDADTDLPSPPQLVSTFDGDDSRQSNGTTSISVGGQSRKTKDGHATTTSLPVSSEAKGSMSLSMVVTMASSSSSAACGPSGTSSCVAPHMAHPNSSCSSQAMPPRMAPAGLTSTVTSLTVKSSPSHPSPHATSGTSGDYSQAPAVVDLCCQCRIHPAMLTVTSATEMRSQKLCSSCYALIQQHRPDGEWENPAPRRDYVPLRPLNATGGCSDAPSTTVIKVLDEHNTGSGGGGGGGSGGAAGGSGCACAAGQSAVVMRSLAPPILSVVSEGGHRGSIHVDGRRTGPTIQKSSEVNELRPVTTETPTNVPCERSKESDHQISTMSVKPTYVSCSKFNLGTEESAERRLEKLTIKPPSSAAEDTECPEVDEAVVSSEEIYRPLPYNPRFADSGPGPYPEPPPLPVGEPPALPSEKQGLDFQAFPAGSVFPYPAQGPPRYEEVVPQGSPSTDPPSIHSAAVRYVSAFGKYGELATQPGAFRSPTRINVSSPGGVVVVTDSAHRTVQAFNAAGECLALIRVRGDSANGCSCLDKRKLTVGTNSGIQIYDFNGTLKKTIPLGGLVINTVSAFRGQGFIAVQPKALSIFRGPSETLIRTLKDTSKPGPVRQPVPFDSIADAAVNSQEDIVVLDAGAASGLGMILIMSDDGYLKSSIVPGREPCGVLRQPHAVAVDSAHNIIVSDSANRRVLLFAANGKFQRQLIGQGHAGGADLKTWPVGLDIGDDDRLFVVTKGEKFAEIRVFSYH